MNLKTQLLLSTRAGLRKRRRPKRLPRQITPRPIQREYYRALLRYVAVVRDALGPLRADLPNLAAREDTHADANPKGVAAHIMTAKKTVEKLVPTAHLEQIATKFGQATTDFQRKQLEKQARAALGVDVLISDRRLAKRMEAFVAENVTLITNVSDKIMSDIAAVVTRGVANGVRHEEIAKELEARIGFGEDRAKLIARDQVGKLYGQVNADRQKELGATHFIWRTVNDERVREEHAALDGQRFAYDDPPADEGLPGEAINCRCYAEIDVDALLDSFDELPD